MSHAATILGNFLADLHKRQQIQDRIALQLAEQCFHTVDGEFYDSASREAYDDSKDEWYRLVCIERRTMIALHRAGHIANPGWILP